jgi:hypothetical protein
MRSFKVRKYQEAEDGSFTLDGVSIPKSEGNRHYRMMNEEVGRGEALIIAYSSRAPTHDEIVGSYVDALDSHFDLVAQSRKYNNRYTCALRAGYAGPFQSEGRSFALWMDSCNAKAYLELDLVMSGRQEAPTIDELIAGLPVIDWS